MYAYEFWEVPILLNVLYSMMNLMDGVPMEDTFLWDSKF